MAAMLDEPSLGIIHELLAEFFSTEFLIYRDQPNIADLILDRESNHAGDIIILPDHQHFIRYFTRHTFLNPGFIQSNEFFMGKSIIKCKA